jgi:hypothetical protein
MPVTQGFTLAMTDTAYSQIFSKLAPTVYGKGSAKSLPTDYLTTIPADLRAEILKRHCRDANGFQSWMIRGFDDRCRAILHSHYPGGINEQGQFDNTQYLTILRSLLPAIPPSDFHLVRPFVSSDYTIVRAISKFNEDGSYGIGVAISNDETGGHKLRVMPLVKRTSCDNSIMVDRSSTSLEMVHRGSIAAMRTQFKAVLGVALKASQELLNRVIEAEEKELDDFSTILEGICKEQGWKNGIRDSVMQGTENRQTVMGIVNGITYAAHAYKIDDQNQMLDMEVYAGSLLYAESREWRRLTLLGERVKEKELVIARR